MQTRFSRRQQDVDVIEGVEFMAVPDREAGIGQWEVVVSAGAEAPAIRSQGAGDRDREQRALTPAGMDIEAILGLFGEWMRLEVGDGKASSATLRAYSSDVRQHLEWLLGQGLTAAQVSQMTMKEWRAHLVASYQVSTAGRKLASVRRFYQMAHAYGMLPANPAYGLKSPRDKTDASERVKFLTLTALQALLEATATARTTAQQVRDRTIIVLMAIHGLRVAEVERLDLGDVDLEAGEAGTLAVVGKGDKRRTILLTDETRLEVEKWLAVRRLIKSDSLALFVGLHWGGPVDELYQRVGRRGIRGMVDGYLEKIGAKRDGVSCHSLRHTFGTQALAAGASLLAISQAMGHASVTTTQVYVKIVDKARNNPAKFLVGVL